MKKFFIPSLLIAVALSSCSKNDITNSSIGNSDENSVNINVAASGTRGVDVTTTKLEKSEGVLLHIKDSGVSTDLTNDAYKFVADESSDWSLSGTSLKWDDIDFPSHFFSMHDGSPQQLTVGDSTATLSYKVSDTNGVDHNDLVYHASVLNAIPAGGKVNVFHKHALSKIHLKAGTGGNKVYIARVNVVNVDSSATATIKPVAVSEMSTANGISWENGNKDNKAYGYYYIGNSAQSALQSEMKDGSYVNPTINENDSASLMIIPQVLTATEKDDIVTPSNSGIEDSYVEVIYYMTDSNDAPVVGYSAVKLRPDAGEFVDEDQETTLYVKAAFPLGYTFEPNIYYNLTLGLGMEGSTGGLLVEDNYVDKDGNPITLTNKDDGTESKPEIPKVDPGDEILGDGDDEIDIVVTVHDWDGIVYSDLK